jgi:hypothetical protein
VVINPESVLSVHQKPEHTKAAGVVFVAHLVLRLLRVHLRLLLRHELLELLLVLRALLLD